MSVYRTTEYNIDQPPAVFIGRSVRTCSSNVCFLGVDFLAAAIVVCAYDLSRLLFLPFCWGVVSCVKDERVFVGHHAVDEANKRAADREVRQQSA